MKAQKSNQRKKVATKKDVFFAIDSIRNITEDSLADALGVTRQTLGNWSREKESK